MRRLARLVAGLLLICVGCPADDDSTPGEASEDVAVEADAEAPDAEGPPALSEVPGLPNLPCLEGEEKPMAWDMSAEKVSVSVFHFNIQYVAGGLDNFLEVWTASEEEIEDLIIVESFEPLVDLFERHPEWGASFEMQGLMLEIMAERHPDILTRLHALAARGQVDVMSYHWSDQLVVAYAKQDMDWSWNENQWVFDSLCMPRAPVHFLQEGQFGPGIAQYAHDKGELMVLPRNLMKLHYQPPPTGLLFSNAGAHVISTDGFAGDGLVLNWNYADDGELIATGDANPYLLDQFVHDPEFLKAEYEDKLTALEADGYLITTLSHYSALLKDRAVEPVPIEPPILDGTWQPDDSLNMHLWMGGSGARPGSEQDNLILTANVQLRRRLAAIEQRLDAAEAVPDLIADPGPARASLRYAIRELLLAEVSDSTGWRPVHTEVEYSLRHQENATKTADEIEAWLDHVAGPTSAAPEDDLVPRDAAPDGLDGITVETTRTTEMRWFDGPDYHLLEFEVLPGDGVTAPTEGPPPVRLNVPLAWDKIVYSPALQHDIVLDVPLSAYAWTQDDRQNGLPLPNGLLGIAEGWTLVLDQRTVHLAALMAPGQVAFEDKTLNEEQAATWRLRFYPAGADEVLPAANALNVDAPAAAE